MKNKLNRDEVKQMKLGNLWDLCSRAHAGISFYQEDRADMYVHEYSHLLEADLKTISEHNGDTERYEEKFIKLFSEWMSAKGRCLSPMITGPANFPVRRNENANRLERNKSDFFSSWRKKVLKKITRPESEIIVKGSSNALELMEKKLIIAEDFQKRMIAGNKILKNSKLSSQEKAEKLAEITDQSIEQGLKNLADRDIYMIFYHFFRGSTTNNGAKIRNLKKDIVREKQTVEASKKGNEEITMKGVKIITNIEVNRLQLVFDGKPSEAVRASLKSFGFRWSGRFTAWQRQLTNNAINSAKSFINSYEAV